MHIKPEGCLLALLERHGLTQYADGFDIPDADFDAQLKDVAATHLDKSEEELRAIAVYATLLHPNTGMAAAPVAEAKKQADNPDLLKATKAVRAQIEGLASTISDGQSRVAAAQADAIVALSKSLRGVDVGADLKAAASRLVQQIDSTAFAISSEQQAIGNAYSDGAAAVAKSCAGFSAAVTTGAQRLKSDIDASGKELAESIGTLSEKLDAFADAVSRVRLAPEVANAAAPPSRKFDYVQIAILVLILIELIAKAHL